MRKQIEFNTRIDTAYFSDERNIWTITTANGVEMTCRYFVAATGPLSIAKEAPFAGVKSYTGEWYQAATWPSQNINLRDKRIAVIGTGATGVQIIPKLAPVAKQLTVFQRTPNYVLPGRNYAIDNDEATNIKKTYNDTWNQASAHPFGLAMRASGRSVKNVTEADEIRQVLDAGWESGGFHFQFETFDDIFTNRKSNDVVSQYLRRKIHAIVQDQHTADLLCPKYPFLSKRPPCGHFYYEAYNRPNVKLVDIKNDDIVLYEKGIRTNSGAEYEFDTIISALGFDAGTGALTEMEVTGSQGRSLKSAWASNVETFAGALVPGFPNMFVVCGPHVPFGNMPIVSEIQVSWIGETIKYMEENRLGKIDVGEEAVHAWSAHLNDAFEATIIAESARASGAWFVGANIPGKSSAPLFYFGGIPGWAAWLDSEKKTAWASMEFSPRAVIDVANKHTSPHVNGTTSTDGATVA